VTVRGAPMRFDKFSFGSIQIDGVTREYDVVIDGVIKAGSAVS
jgi:hypothetical protein